ncbi:S1/P1 nuclease [Roseateles oligotrophus]|uniref:S1/P1 nuclease n=1 Tax=Roseateles oligotrophus TaxID=1769250 RepID=A0ABT2YCH9_9BURK|nr:S1/P1 nuclease [Roseateles oligotrophus]MCV2367732.1 S1/P1 nuclease [Roseateles oligotrophus]
MIALLRFRQPIAVLFVAAALFGQAKSAQAWGADGHRLIASVAEQGLNPAARAELTRLLALEPGSTLASISTWADEHRSPQTAPWHYVNFPRDAACVYEPQRDCEGGACVVAAIQRQTALLRNSADDPSRLKALKYVVHLVADVHQPLHAGFGDDRGGNSYQLHGFGRGSNLHALWDSGLILNRPGAAAALEAQISEAITLKVDLPSSPNAAAHWASESCRIASMPGFYPAGHKVDQSYADAHDQPLRAQLRVAAQRLAEVLNDSLGKQAEVQAAL